MYKMHEERYKQSFCKYQLSTEFQSLFFGGGVLISTLLKILNLSLAFLSYIEQSMMNFAKMSPYFP